MPINFPSSPSNNQLFVTEGKAMRYNATKNRWKAVSTLSSSQITDLEARTVGVSSMSISGNTLVIQKDDSSYANVSLAPFAGNKLTTYANASILPLSDLVSGTQVYVEDTDSLYITDGSGWYKIATVNLSPSLTLGVSSISLGPSGSVDVNYTVNEPEDTPYTVSASATSNATITVHQANNTITFNSPVQNTSETITITATDGVNSVGDTLTMSITLVADWSSATQQARVQKPSPTFEYFYGNPIDLSNDGNTMLVSTFNKGLHINTRSGSTWSEQQFIGPGNVSAPTANGTDIHPDGRCFSSVAISGDGNTLICGNWRAENNLGSARGRSYIFTRSSNTWTQQAYLEASNANQLGWSVAISGDGNTAVAGDPAAQSATVYTRSGSTWSIQQQLTASDGVGGDAFGGYVKGVSISNDGNTIAVGARNHGTYGAAYIFTLSSGTWSQQQKITPGDTDALGFGEKLHLDEDGDTIIVGAARSGGAGTDAGAAYIFTLSGGTWSQQAKLTSSESASNDWFGGAVNISNDGNIAIVGAFLDDRVTASQDVGYGTAWIFTRSGSTWSETKKLVNSGTRSHIGFGMTVAISGDSSTIAVGASHDGTGATKAGAVYVFEQ